MDPAAPASFTFEITGPLTDDFTAGGLRLEAAWLIDANGETRDVQQNIRKQGAKTFLDVVADVYGLAYPIEIDPTVTLQPDGATGKDTYINSANPSNNYGVSTSIDLGNNSGAVNRVLLQFDLSAIPIGSSVTSSTLTLTANGSGNSGNFIYMMYLITSV
jgi:hypothetical protein